MNRGHVFTGELLEAIQLRARGAGGKMKGKCVICHGIESGNTAQKFPVGKGTIEVAGMRICRTHAAVLEEIAADAGVSWAAAP